MFGSADTRTVPSRVYESRPLTRSCLRVLLDSHLRCSESQTRTLSGQLEAFSAVATFSGGLKCELGEVHLV